MMVILLNHQYWYAIPNIGDDLALTAKSLFTVKSRLLPTNDSNRVFLFVTIKIV
jgi:hypothetical protein